MSNLCLACSRGVLGVAQGMDRPDIDGIITFLQTLLRGVLTGVFNTASSLLLDLLLFRVVFVFADWVFVLGKPEKIEHKKVTCVIPTRNQNTACMNTPSF